MLVPGGRCSPLIWRLRPSPTVGLPAGRRVELCEMHRTAALVGLDVQTSEPLVATELNVQLPHVDLAQVDGSVHVVLRTEKVIERNPADASLST